MAKRRSPSANRPPPSPNRPPPSNRLLAALPPDDYARVFPTLKTLPLDIKQTLHKAGEPVREVYFPGGGFVSMLTVLEDGTMVEIATVGREGLTGLPAALNGDLSIAQTIVQAKCAECYRMPVAAFHEEMDRPGVFRDLVNRYHHALVGLIMQSTACNAIHSVEQRLARWLLMAHDRIGATDFPMTQEFLAMMLGASRPTVTVVAGMLQSAGLITYHRGHITILDRERLESASCECYRAATDLMKRVNARAPKSR
jgi:CRP-like cAMP-binding protein